MVLESARAILSRIMAIVNAKSYPYKEYPSVWISSYVCRVTRKIIVGFKKIRQINIY